MGMMAATCCVSGLPIERPNEGVEAVRIFLLTRNPFSENWRTGFVSQINDVWMPRTIPLRAVYDSCGPSQIEKGPLQDVWLQALAFDLVEVPREQTRRHFVSVEKGMSLENLLSAVHEGDVFVRDDITGRYGRKISETGVEPTCQIALAMVREDVWQVLLQIVHSEVDQLREMLLGVYARTHITHALYVKTQKSLRELAERHPKEFENIGSWPDSDASALFSIVPQHDSSGVLGLYTHADLLYDRNVPAETYVEPFAEFLAIQRFLATCGYKWRPVRLYGEQDAQYAPYVQMFEAFLRVAEALSSQRKYPCDEE